MNTNTIAELTTVDCCTEDGLAHLYGQDSTGYKLCVFMLSGELHWMYYFCGSQLESKNPHMTFRATGFPYGFSFPFLLSLLCWITAWMLMPGSSHCDRKSLFFLWCNCLVTSCISVSLSVLRFKCKLVYFQKKKKNCSWRAGKWPWRKSQMFLPSEPDTTHMLWYANDREFLFCSPFIS